MSNNIFNIIFKDTVNEVKRIENIKNEEQSNAKKGGKMKFK